jgi:hypothetical protein
MAHGKLPRNFARDIKVSADDDAAGIAASIKAALTADIWDLLRI